MNQYDACTLNRYSCREMRELFGRELKFKLWRRLWIYLAESQKELGLEISDRQIREMKQHADDISLERIDELEEETRHEVMANIRAFGEQCPEAEPIIHLGATSMYVMDNADLIRFRRALEHLGDLLAGIVEALTGFARDHASEPILGLTHLQPAQVTTVGKRASQWLSGFLGDLKEVRRLQEELPFRGVKGAVGTQASFLRLFDGDHEKVQELDRKVAGRAGFDRVLKITGQTYSRKLDTKILNCLTHMAESAGKFAVDLRLLQSRNEMQEPIEDEQVGSSAMAYKKNPIRSERISGLSRYLIENAGNAPHTSSTQWMERSLDDSSNRRVLFPHAFQAADGMLRTVLNVSRGLVVNREKIRQNLEPQLPYVVTEDVLMEMVRKGGNRQKIHERIRKHARKAAEKVEKGEENDLVERLKNDNNFEPIHDRLEELADPSGLSGRARAQVEQFLEEDVEPVLDEEENTGLDADLSV